MEKIAFEHFHTSIILPNEHFPTNLQKGWRMDHPFGLALVMGGLFSALSCSPWGRACSPMDHQREGRMSHLKPQLATKGGLQLWACCSLSSLEVHDYQI